MKKKTTIKVDSIKQNSRERRSYFRLDDDVMLEVRKIEPEKLRNELESASEKRHSFSYMNSVICQKEQYLPHRRYIEKNHPEIAGYLNHIDQKLDALARLLIVQNDTFDHCQTKRINLSATGARITVHQLLSEGESVEIKMQLLPSMARIYVIGMVVWSCELTDRNEKVTEIAVDFTYIDPADREVIIKHLHEKQIESLNKRI